MTEKIKCILDSNRGIYIPKFFAEDFDLSKFEGINDEDIETLKSGPDAEWYWEAWESVLNNAKHTDDEGIEWTLHHDGDLFLVATDELSDEDFENFFEVPRD